MKFCPQCQTLKSLSEFSPRSGERSHQLRSWCKACNVKKSKEAFDKDPEASRAKDREYHKKGYDKVMEKRRSEPAEVTARRRKKKILRHAERMKSDPSYRIAVNLRQRLYYALRASGAKKSQSTLALTGCPVIWLEIHLASLFKPGMTLQNYGSVWHIDHIKPCAKFDLTKPEEQRACCHWTNLQPLFVLENLKKRDFYDATSEQSSKEIGGRCCQALTL